MSNEFQFSKFGHTVKRKDSDNSFEERVSSSSSSSAAGGDGNNEQSATIIVERKPKASLRSFKTNITASGGFGGSTEFI